MLRSMRNVVVTIALMVLAALLTPATSGASATASDDPMVGAPRVGACYNVGLELANTAASISKATVKCSTKHTLKVIATVPVPEDIPLDASGRSVQTFALSKCRPAVKTVLGNNNLKYAESTYYLWIFAPTAAQQESGSRWITCTTGAIVNKSRLASSTTGRLVQVTKKLPKRLRLCGSKSFNAVSCARPHKFHVARSKLVAARYTTTRANRVASNFCPKHVKSGRYMWVSRPLAAKTFALTCMTR